MSDTGNVNHSLPPRRVAREQEQRLDQAGSAIIELLNPVMQIWAMCFTLVGDNYIGMANLISRWSEGERPTK